MRGSRIKTLVFYAVLFYFLYRFFIADNEETLSEVADPPAPEMPTAQTDRNIIIRLLSLALSIIPWGFSCIWSVLGLFWSSAVFLWGIINHIWTVAMLIVNGVYLAITFYAVNRHRRKSVEYFFEMAFIYLVVPAVVNFLLLRKEIAFNLMLPIYLALFVSSMGGRGIDGNFPRNLVFFVGLCAIL